MEKYQHYLHTFMEEFDFPQEAKTELNEVYERVFSDAAALQGLGDALALYKEQTREGCVAMVSFCKALAEKTGEWGYSLYMIALILLTEVAKGHYEKAGIPLTLWKENFVDLKYKLIECKLVKGVWGTFVPDWYFGFFDVSRFAFGKLQFELVDFGRSYSDDEVVLTEKNPVINVHIPRTGTRLTPKDVDEALEKAAEFFKKKYDLDEAVFVCHSWLLYPANKDMLSPSSNLYSFINRFHIIEVEEYQNYKEVWRLFDCEYDGDASKLPADTSFRRAYVDRIQRGEKMGCGYGFFVYKPCKK